MDHQPIGDDAHVGAAPLYVRAADGQSVLGLRHLAADQAIGALVLQEDDGVVVAHGALEQPLGVVRRRRRHDLETGRVREERLDALGMVKAAPHAAPVRGAQHHRRAHPAVRAVAHAGRLADDLVYRGPDEVGELDLRDGPHPVEGGAQPDAGDRRLGQRRVDHPLLAEPVHQPFGRQEDPASRANVLAHDEDALVPCHLLVDGLTHGLEHGHYRDGCPPAWRSGE